MTDTPDYILGWLAAIEAAANDQKHKAEDLYRRAALNDCFDHGAMRLAAEKREAIADEIRALPPPGDLRAALSTAPEVQALVEVAVKRALEVAWGLGVDHTTEGPPANDWQEGNNYGVFSYRAAIRAIAADPDAVKRIAEGGHE